MRVRFLALIVLFVAIDAAPQSSGPQQAPPATPAATSPQSDPFFPDSLLEQADEEEKVDYIRSTVDLEYRHDRFDDGSLAYSLWFRWLQAFGPSKRLAAGIELPLIHDSGPDETGLGDISLGFRRFWAKGRSSNMVSFRHLTG